MNCYNRGFAIVLLMAFSQCWAEPLKCVGEGSAPVTTLDELPAAVQQMLGRSRTGSGGIADIGGKFNPGCVIVGEPVPMRRLVSGKLSEQCIQLVVEYGGVGHSQRTLEYQLLPAGWRQVTGMALDQLPKAPQLAPR